MNRTTIIIVSLALCFAGCALNVNELSMQKTAQIPSAGVKAVKINEPDWFDDLTVTGSDDSVIMVQATLEQLVANNGPGDLENVEMHIDTAESIATVSLGCSSGNWESIELKKITVTPDKKLGLECNLTSGNIQVSNMYGYSRAKCTSGNINLETVQGCNCETTSGNLEIRLLDVDTTFVTFTDITLKAVSGNITVRVPKGFSADLALNVTSGNIEVPAGSTHEKLNNGNDTRKITCKATSGNIRIVEE